MWCLQYFTLIFHVKSKNHSTFDNLLVTYVIKMFHEIWPIVFGLLLKLLFFCWHTSNATSFLDGYKRNK